MADDSNIVLRMEIDNAKATFETFENEDFKVESGVFNEGGFKWVVTLEDRMIYLRCGVDHGGPWMCEGKLSCYSGDGDWEYDLYYTEAEGGHRMHGSQKCRFFLNDRTPLYEVPWLNILSEEDIINDKVTLEFRIRITKSDRGEPNAEPFKFDVPSPMSSVILKIGENKLHVSKEILSTLSPYFEAMFFGGFFEKGKEEVEIKDVIYEEFIDFLNVIYPRQQGRYWITDSSILHVLALGDRFDMEHAMVLAETHLHTVSMFKMAEKLLLADQYRRVKLRDYCIQTITWTSDVEELKSTPEYANFSDEMKTAIEDRMKKRMTDGSDNFVWRWRIKNARASLATGKVESGVFRQKGFRWTASVEKMFGMTEFTVRCGVEHSKRWKCEAEVSISLHTASGIDRITKKERVIFDGNTYHTAYPHLYYKTLKSRKFYNINDTVIVEFRICIKSSKGGEPIAATSKFAAPNNRSDVILKVGDEKLYVNKEYLAIHSPVFEVMFFGEFAEKDKDEAEIKDVDHKEFTDLLNLIYPGVTELTERKIPHILKLADRFQLQGVIDKVENLLINSTRFEEDKLQLADQYRLVRLRDHYLKSFSTTGELLQKCNSNDFSMEMKAAIFDRLTQISSMGTSDDDDFM